VTEICGDVPLSRPDRWLYLVNGLRQIAQSLKRRFPAELVHVDFSCAEIQSKIREGASPLRVYTSAIVGQVVPEYIGVEGPVCDIGCGGGGHLRFFENYGGRHFYLGLDITFNPGWHSARIRRCKIPCRFAQMSAVDLGLGSNSIAFTFSSSALEHIPNVQQAVCEIARTMRPGGYGLHIVPGVWSLFLYVYHGYRRFHPQELGDLFQGAGLEIQQIWSIGGLPSFILHSMWITWLETRLVQKLLRHGERMRQGKALRIYSYLLYSSLRFDWLLPFLPIGYAVLVRKPLRV